jgi:hypothetical protein
MKERPILFSGPMVRAIRDGTKTKTRRIVKPCKDMSFGCALAPHEIAGEVNNGDYMNSPYGQPGDRLWVRETYFAFGRWITRFSANKKRDEWHFIDMTQDTGNDYLYAADGVSDTDAFIKKRNSVTPMYWKRPAIFMPRWASRINLEITGVRVERLKDISEQDAIAEGVKLRPRAISPSESEPFYWDYMRDEPAYRTARDSFASLWESINGPGSWDSNPWVWVIEFRRVQP